jgi:Ca2+-binding EF-hand superfamily protein
LQVDKDGNGSISLSEYFGIFEVHGIVVNRAETNRVIRLAGEDGNLTKDNFVKIVQGSDFFMKSFDKNKDGEVTEVKLMYSNFID